MEKLIHTKGKLLGVDFGDKRTGLAVSNEAQSMASGIGQVSAGNMQKTAEAVAAGKPASMELAEAFSQAVKEDINPRDSWRAAKDFRMHIAVESAKRAFIESVRLAGGEL